MAVAKLTGKTKIVATWVLGSPAGEPPFHRIAEVYFPSMEALEQCAASDGGKRTIGNAVPIWSGGARRESFSTVGAVSQITSNAGTSQLRRVR